MGEGAPEVNVLSTRDDGGMHVTVMYFDGCPSWRTAVERVHVAAGQAGVRVQVATQAVETREDAERLGFTGSPTILIDGRDPFSRPGLVPALACRVYSTSGGLAGSPTVDQLVEALAGRLEPTSG